MDFSEQTQSAIFVDNVTKSYSGGSPTLQNLTMNVDTGIVYGLLGSSGCGKTTLLSCILGLKEWNSGKIAVHGINVSKGSPVQSSKVGYMPQDCALQDYLTPKEIFLCYGCLYGMTKDNIEEKWEELSKLLDMQKLQNQKIDSLSGGQKRRVSLAVTLIHNPDLLILDEPTVGLDPLLRMGIWDYLHQLVKSTKATVLVTTHYVEELRRANMVGVMRNCKLIVEQDPASLMASFETSLLEEAVLKACRKNEILSNVNFFQNNLIRNELASILQIFPNNYKTEVNLMQKSPLSLVRISCASQFDSFAEKNPESVVQKRNSISKALFERIYKLFMFAYFLELGILRDLRLVVIVLLFPVIQIVIGILVFGTEIALLPLGVINNENPNWTKDCAWSAVQNWTNHNAGCVLIEDISKKQTVIPIQFLSREAAESEVALGNIYGYLDIPEQFTQKLVNRAAFGLFPNDDTINGTIIRMRMDNSNVIVSYTIISSIYKSLIDSLKNLSKLMGIDQELNIPLKERFPGVYGHPNTTVVAVIGALAAILMPLEVTLIAAPLILLNEKNNGTMQRIRLAGLGTVQFMLAIALALLPHVVISTVITYWCLLYGFGFEFYCPLATSLFQGILAGVAGISFGICVAVVVRDLVTVILVLIFIIPSLWYHVGIIRPVENIPKILRYISYYCFPLVSLAETAKSTINRGLPLTHSTAFPGVWMTVGWIIVAFMISVIFRKVLHN